MSAWEITVRPLSRITLQSTRLSARIPPPPPHYQIQSGPENLASPSSTTAPLIELMMERTTLPLGEDVVLSIIAFLDIGDILSLRQVCKALKEITCHRSIWAYRYTEMVRERQLQLPEHDLALSSLQLEKSVRRGRLIDRHWHRASPIMDSLRLVNISTEDRNFFEGIFLAPGGRWLLLFNSTAVDVVDLEDSSSSPEPFFRLSDAGIQGHCHSVFSTTGNRDGESLVFFATINSVDSSLGTTFAFWSANFRDSPPISRFLGCVNLPDRCSKARIRNDLFLCTREHTKYIVIFDWKLALEGATPFRYYCLRYLSPQNPNYDLRDFCLLENSYILAMDSAALWIQLFSPPQFQLVDSLHQPLPREPATPVWEYVHKSAESPRLAPIFLYPIWRFPHIPADSEIPWPVAALIVNRDGGFYTLIAELDHGDCTRYGYLRGGLKSRFSRFSFSSRAVAVTANMAGDGWRIDCFSVNEQVNTESAALDRHGSFSLMLEDMGLQYDMVYQDPGPIPTFDEESGRMCFLMPDWTPDSRAIVVLELVDPQLRSSS